MKGVDTNILVRFLVGDDEIQSKKVYKLFKKLNQKMTHFLFLCLSSLSSFGFLNLPMKFLGKKLLNQSVICF